MHKACFNCEYEENPCDQNGELTEPCKSCLNYLNFKPKVINWNKPHKTLLNKTKKED